MTSIQFYQKAVKVSDGNSPLGTIKLGSAKSLNKYTISPYLKDVAKDNYVALPAIGPFMMFYSDQFKKNLPAAWVYWLGDGQTNVEGHYQPVNHVLEPINFIFVVKGFDTRKQSNEFITDKLSKADFTKEYSDQHSSGYSGVFKNKDGSVTTMKQIGGIVNDGYHGYTFEDVDNPDIGGNHFRLFGPYEDKDNHAYVYTASLSKESPRYYKDGVQCGHMFESFTTAKSKLAINLLDNTKAKIYSTNLFTAITSSKSADTVNAYYTGDQQATTNQVSNVAFVAVFDK